MGTRSTVKFYKGGKCLLALYNQYDGYYEGVGQELVDFFENKENYGNGFEDTALLYVCYKKQGKAYNTYLTTERDEQEFNYEIYQDNNELCFRIREEKWDDKYGTILVDTLKWSTLEEFKNYIEENSVKGE